MKAAIAMLFVAGGQCSTIGVTSRSCSPLISRTYCIQCIQSVSRRRTKSLAEYVAIRSQPCGPGLPATTPSSRRRRLMLEFGAVRNRIAFVHSHRSYSRSYARPRLTKRTLLIQLRAYGVRSEKNGAMASTCVSKSNVYELYKSSAISA